MGKGCSYLASKKSRKSFSFSLSFLTAETKTPLPPSPSEGGTNMA